MRASFSRRLAGAAFGLAASALLSVFPAQAQTVAEFAANPAAVIAQFPNGGPALISLVNQAVTANPGLLQAVAGAMAGAGPNQQSAIGAGLGQVAQAALASGNQAFYNQIAAAVAASGAADAQTAFAGATGATQTAATGAGGDGGGGGGGGNGGPAGTGSGTGGGAPSGGSNAGTPTAGGTNPTQTPTATFTGGGAGGANGGSSSTSGGGTTATAAVSTR